MSVTSFLTVWVYLLTPAEPLHELTHMVFAAPFARSVSYERDGMWGAYADIEWSASTPVVWVRVAHLAPTIVGTAVVVACLSSLPWVIWFVERLGFRLATWVGIPAVADEFSALIALFSLLNWVMYCWPSSGDLRPFEA
jgi:hypothetical protein